MMICGADWNRKNITVYIYSEKLASEPAYSK